ncbi:hypothetical protein D0Y65_018103 [Glycine soja]|uniref:Uncharacterized protein n=1 Tax=Glycine soja TaxID=3848 RepID=A0A445JXR2_GLYSO|nr:hypothetical protein D0Y65_018103 [Glycine soja]
MQRHSVQSSLLEASWEKDHFYNTISTGHAIGANPAIPRMFPNMFPLVTSQVYFLFLFANSGYAMQCFFIYFTHSCFFLKLQLSMYS